MGRLTKDELECILNRKNVKVDVVVGIDPDIEKNGVARLNVATRNADVCTLSFADTLDCLHGEKQRCEVNGLHLVVVVEAGWLNHSNWHLNKYDTRASACAKGISVGRNQEVGRKLIEMCEHWGIRVEAMKPLVKCWSGHDRKITQAEIEEVTCQKIARTNQEGRDACLLAWCYAGFPMRILPKIAKKCNKLTK